MAEITVPYEFSIQEGVEPTTENLPSKEGAAFGQVLANLAQRGMRLTLERFPDTLPMCDDCAFREGTRPNQSLATVADAYKCVIECVSFNCHKGITDNESPKRICAGWLACMEPDLHQKLVEKEEFIRDNKSGVRRAILAGAVAGVSL